MFLDKVSKMHTINLLSYCHWQEPVSLTSAFIMPDDDIFVPLKIRNIK